VSVPTVAPTRPGNGTVSDAPRSARSAPLPARRLTKGPTLARHSAPSRRTARRGPDAVARRGRTTRAASTGVLTATVLGGGSLLNGEHLPTPPVAVDRATMTVASTPDGAVPTVGVAPLEQAPDSFDAAALVKAVLLTERREAQQREAEQREAERRATSCADGDTGFETVQRRVSEAGVELRCRFGVDTVYGVAGRSGASDHPSGLALDLMVDRDPGEDLAAYAVANMDRLGIKYVIYRQRINFGSGWEAMEDRGGVTANHMDHVHVSFDRR